MTGILNFSGKGGKQRGILTIYVLHSLKKKPKSGYDILAEINKKTEGKWTPSKGTIYPLLKKLKDEGLIKVNKTGDRSKNIFELTNKGKKSLLDIGKHKKEWKEKFIQFRKLFSDVLGEENVDVTDLIFEINEISFVSSAEKKDKIFKILEHCLSDLKRI